MIDVDIGHKIGSVFSMIGSVLKRCLKVLSYDRVCSLMGLICDYVTRSDTIESLSVISLSLYA